MPSSTMPPTVLMPDQVSRMAASDFTRDLDLLDDELVRLLDITAELKATPTRYSQALAGKSVALLFEKPSLRTRVTFELAVQQLGGIAVLSEGPIGTREPLKDVARNLDRWVAGIVARVFSQDTIDALAHWSSVPVINALSDMYHPCQALADVFTIKEVFGPVAGKTVAFSGDGNNVSHSLMLTALRLGMNFRIACPKGFEPNAEVLATAQTIAFNTGSRLTVTHDLSEALAGADAVYTDVWASMGQESEAAARRAAFAPYQVTAAAFDQAAAHAIFLHCLPAKRGEEVMDDVMEHPRSRVFDQAENRLHTQKALLLMLL